MFGGCSGPKHATCAHGQRLLSTPPVAQILGRMLLQLYGVTLSGFTAGGHQNVRDYGISAHTPTRKGQWGEELPLGQECLSGWSLCRGAAAVSACAARSRGQAVARGPVLRAGRLLCTGRCPSLRALLAVRVSFVLAWQE